MQPKRSRALFPLVHDPGDQALLTSTACDPVCVSDLTAPLDKSDDRLTTRAATIAPRRLRVASPQPSNRSRRDGLHKVRTEAPSRARAWRFFFRIEPFET